MNYSKFWKDWAVYYSIFMSIFIVGILLTYNCEWCVGTLATFTNSDHLFINVICTVFGLFVTVAGIGE